MKHELRLVLVALQFLTRVPVPNWVGFEPAWLQACARHFPLIGALVGAFGAAVLWLALIAFPPAVAAGLSMISTLWLTGAFHEDGLADTVDALGGAVSRERALVIMKDSRIGAYGAIALVMTLGLKAATLTALLEADASAPFGAVGAMVWAHAASRMAPLWLLHRLPYAGDPEHAKAKPFAMRIDGAGVAVGAGWLLVVGAAVYVLSQDAVALRTSLAAAVVATLLCARWLMRRLQGFTGDTLGAVQQIVELTMLLAWLAALRLAHD